MLDVPLVFNQPCLNVFVEFDMVDAVSENASLWNDGPAKTTLLVGVDDRLTSQTGPVRRVVVAHPHGQLAFAGSGRNVGSKRRVSNEDTAVLAL